MSTLALPYLSVLRVRFQLMLQYRTAAWAGVATQFWFGAIRVMTLVAFYVGTGQQPMNLPQVVTYIWLGQAFLAMLPWAPDAEIAVAVESGNVGYERLRPVDTYFLWYARALAWRVANTALRAGPVFILAALILPLTAMADWRWRLPTGGAAAALFVASITLTALLSSAFTALLNIVLVHVKTPRVGNFAMGFTNLFSGLVIPLALFPHWAQPFLLWQPFAGLADIPFRIYTGALAGATAAQGLASQVLWILLLVLLGRWWLARVLAHIDMQGG
ncbi:MAG: ABC transporter permease [Alphaproteobacteria bacterium]|nr:ABC transporter permease [Alphaproteobacteria bacterium]MBL6936703.1 ABC transporter permease [Alphaproteobacteria bacterium]MBL7097472.1 ABC transporter permease [Alphaproteobacteria bacterium]